MTSIQQPLKILKKQLRNKIKHDLSYISNENIVNQCMMNFLNIVILWILMNDE